MVVRGGRWRRGCRGAARQAGRYARTSSPPSGTTNTRRRADAELRAHGVEVEAAVRDRPQRRGVAFLDARGERTIAVLGDRLVPASDDGLPWGRLAEMDGVYFTGGDVAALRAARAARMLVATPRARDALKGSDVTLDALVRSAGDAGEQDDRERPGWSARLTVATRGVEGGTYATQMAGPAPSRPPRSPARSWTPTAPATPSRPGSPSGSARAWPSTRPWRWPRVVARESDRRRPLRRTADRGGPRPVMRPPRASSSRSRWAISAP